jgi:hypothetical protein
MIQQLMWHAAQTQHDMLLGFKQQTLTTYLTRSSMNIVAGPMLPLSARGAGCGSRLNCCRLNRCGRGHVSPRDACSCAATCQRAGCGAFTRDAPAEAAAWGGGRQNLWWRCADRRRDSDAIVDAPGCQFVAMEPFREACPSQSDVTLTRRATTALLAYRTVR